MLHLYSVPQLDPANRFKSQCEMLTSCAVTLSVNVTFLYSDSKCDQNVIAPFSFMPR